MADLEAQECKKIYRETELQGIQKINQIIENGIIWNIYEGLFFEEIPKNITSPYLVIIDSFESYIDSCKLKIIEILETSICFKTKEFLEPELYDYCLGYLYVK